MKNKTLGALLLAGVKSFENGKVLTLTDRSGWGPTRNYTGQPVNEVTALQDKAVWPCVNLKSGTMATLPLFLNERTGDGGKRPAEGHPLYSLLKYRPNADMTAVVFWKILFACIDLWGAFWVEKVYTGSRITSLRFLWPQALTWRRLDNGAVLWAYNDPLTRTTRNIDERHMWFCPWYTLDGVTPLSPVRVGANVIGGSIAADKASAETFTNGMKSSGMVTIPTYLQPRQREEMRTHVETVSRGGGVMVLEGSTGFHQLTMNPQDAELLATRAFDVATVCSWFGVDPTLIGQGSDKNSNWGTGLFEKKQGFVDFCLRPLAVVVEASIRENLLEPADRAKYSAEWVFEGLLRGNPTTRAQYYATMHDKGFITSNEVRALENLPLMGGNAGVLVIQSNMIPLDDLGKEPAAASAAADAVKNWLEITGEDHAPAP